MAARTVAPRQTAAAVAAASILRQEDDDNNNSHNSGFGSRRTGNSPEMIRKMRRRTIRHRILRSSTPTTGKLLVRLPAATLHLRFGSSLPRQRRFDNPHTDGKRSSTLTPLIKLHWVPYFTVVLDSFLIHS